MQDSRGRPEAEVKRRDPLLCLAPAERGDALSPAGIGLEKQVLRASGHPYCIIRAPPLTAGPSLTERWTLSEAPIEGERGRQVAGKDLADAVMDVMKNADAVGRTYYLGRKPV